MLKVRVTRSEAIQQGELRDYRLAALCPAEFALYERLGWRFWRGPLGIRMPSGETDATPEERIMILKLPGTPQLDLDAPLSAEWRARGGVVMSLYNPLMIHNIDGGTHGLQR